MFNSNMKTPFQSFYINSFTANLMCYMTFFLFFGVQTKQSHDFRRLKILCMIHMNYFHAAFSVILETPQPHSSLWPLKHPLLCSTEEGESFWEGVNDDKILTSGSTSTWRPQVSCNTPNNHRLNDEITSFNPHYNPVTLQHSQLLHSRWWKSSWRDLSAECEEALLAAADNLLGFG